MENTSTSAFARLLATENIRVQHLADAETASFNVVDRVLTLPKWKNMSGSLYDMLIGHEVAHALWTPGDIAEDGEHLAAAVEIDPENPMRAMGFLNVVEDARIERLIKDKYPGIRRDFVAGYRWLWDNMDLFQSVIEEEGGLSNMTLADRLNLHFKLGLLGHISVPFSKDEQSFVDRMETATTWDDVMDLTRDLYEHAKAEGNQQTPVGQDILGSGNGEEGGDEDGFMKPVTENAFGEGLDKLRDHAKTWGGEEVDEMPDPILEQIIINADEIEELIMTPYAARWTQDDDVIDPEESRRMQEQIQQDRNKTGNLFDEWVRTEMKTVNYLVKQFEMRKAADEHQRTMITKSGRLDTLKMINYKWSEDIFGKNTNIREGKNHGFVFLLDWSGSMGNVLLSTVKQAITLALFCQKINVPFDLYAFSSSTKSKNNDWKTHSYESRPDSEVYWNGPATLNPMQLLHFLSSTRGRKNLMKDLKNLYHVAFLTSSERYEVGFSMGHLHHGLELGGTPLDEGIICLHKILPQFRARHGVQVLNTVILTDGDGHCELNNVIYNPRLKRNFGDHPDHQSKFRGTRGAHTTQSLLYSLKEETGTNLIGMYLYDGKQVANCYGWVGDDMNHHVAIRDQDKECRDRQRQYARENFFVANGFKCSAYDEAYIINAGVAPKDEIEIPDDASHAKMRNAFVKGMAQRSMSRVLSNRLVDRIAC